MNQILQIFILIPLGGFILSLLIPQRNESKISYVAITTAAANLAGITIFIIYWLMHDHPILDVKQLLFYRSSQGFEIMLDFFFDTITAVYAFIGAFLMCCISIFSKYYLHRDEGFKRYFNFMLLFYVGYNIVIFSGNFETLFAGWEVLGISSFLLIAFYRNRFLPIKNGLKTIFIYRIGDICLILAMWLSHHLWHENITFIKLGNTSVVRDLLQSNMEAGLFISFMILIAASAKSAQLPFSSWLPRAMEGPTTSSAIFYGSLSVHIGVFVLLRTFPFWESLLLIKGLIILIGVITSLVATGIARVQSTVKTQIAYSSIAQIGIIFIEVALGFHGLALVHFMGNAFLRTYQLLVSPSVLNYLIHDQFFNFTPKVGDKQGGFTSLKNAFYILCLKEWNLDHLIFKYFWNPFKLIGKKFNLLSNKFSVVYLLIAATGGIMFHANFLFFPNNMVSILAGIFSLTGLILVVSTFSGRANALRSWINLLLAQFFVVLSISLNNQFEFDQIIIYMSGVLLSSFTGYICLNKINTVDNALNLDQFHGYIFEFPKIGLVFLISCLGFLGFPFTPTYIGVDLLFSHIRHDQYVLITLTALTYLFLEISVLRIYARIFLGKYKKSLHATPFRSS